MYIGLYFGSFNPIHNGHITIATQMLNKVGFDEVWLVVSPLNPLKSSEVLASNEHRLKMAKLALQHLSLPIKVSDVEFSLPTPSFTIDTLEYLSATYPSHRFAVIMGSDNMASIERWRSYQEILQRYPIYFYPREGDKSEELAQRYSAHCVDAEYLDLSSTMVRQRASQHLPINSLVPAAVARYIADHHLYQ